MIANRKTQYALAVLVAVLLALPLIAVDWSLSNKAKTTKTKASITTTTNGIEKFEELAATETTTTLAPQIKTQTIIKENPDLAICAQALYDMAPVIRSYFDAMRNYENAYILNHEPYSKEAWEFGVANERQGDSDYEKQWKIFTEHCDKYVTNHRPNNWG